MKPLFLFQEALHEKQSIRDRTYAFFLVPYSADKGDQGGVFNRMVPQGI